MPHVHTHFRLGTIACGVCLALLAACAHPTGKYSSSREIVVEREWGVPLANARVLKVDYARSPSSRYIADIGESGHIRLDKLRTSYDSGLPREYYIITAPGYEPFIVWPAMLEGTLEKGPGFALLNGSLVITPTPESTPAQQAPPATPRRELLLPGQPPAADAPAVSLAAAQGPGG